MPLVDQRVCHRPGPNSNHGIRRNLEWVVIVNCGPLRPSQPRASKVGRNGYPRSTFPATSVICLFLPPNLFEAGNVFLRFLAVLSNAASNLGFEQPSPFLAVARIFFLAK